MSPLGVRRDKAALSSGCKSHPATAPSVVPANQFRQLGEFAAIRRASSEVRRRAPSRLLLEIDVGERVVARVPDDEASARFLDRLRAA
jgi:hypothetical protein